MHHGAEGLVAEEVDVDAVFAVLQPHAAAVKEGEEPERLGNRTLDLNDAVIVVLDLPDGSSGIRAASGPGEDREGGLNELAVGLCFLVIIGIRVRG